MLESNGFVSIWLLTNVGLCLIVVLYPFSILVSINLSMLGYEHLCIQVLVSGHIKLDRKGHNVRHLYVVM